MFVIRQARPQDLDDLHSLAKQTFFINLPPDREIIGAKIEQSQRSFSSLARGIPGGESRRMPAAGSGIHALTKRSHLFLFVMEDMVGGGIVGTSQIISRMGGKGHPRVFLKLGEMTRRSESLKLSWTHRMARLEEDETGPSEIGGLILNHAFRGHKQRLGRFLSFVRFHMMGLHRRRFASRVVAEMLGPIDKSGYNPFFEKFTRHFIPRSFPEVYKFSQASKEFVLGLMPPDWIDLSIMDPEVTHAAGAVSTDTVPARRMLERLGFAYLDRIDPMDGGPHLEARIDSISLVKATQPIRQVVAGARKTKEPALIVSCLDGNGEFRAIQTPGELARARATVTTEALRWLGPTRGLLGATRLP